MATPEQIEIQRLKDEVKRVNINFDAHLQEHMAILEKHAKSLTDKDTAHSKAIAELNDKYKAELKLRNEQHATALARAIAEPPEVRAHRERVAKIQAEAQAAIKAANEEHHAAMAK